MVGLLPAPGARWPGGAIPGRRSDTSRCEPTAHRLVPKVVLPTAHHHHEGQRQPPVAVSASVGWSFLHCPCRPLHEGSKRLRRAGFSGPNPLGGRNLGPSAWDNLSDAINDAVAVRNVII